MANAPHASADPLLGLPLFDPGHRELAARVRAFAHEHVEPQAAAADAGDVNAIAKDFITRIARAGFLAALADVRDTGRPDARTLCLIREGLAGSSAVADAVFAVHGLGLFPILTAATDEVKQQWLPRMRSGEAIGAFAMTEPEAGSDVAGIATTARPEAQGYVLDGAKTLISNAGIANVYVVLARQVDVSAREARAALGAFVVPADTPGLQVTRSLQLMAPHPIGDLELRNCHVPSSHRLGGDGEGVKVAYSTLDFFRPSVGAAACGLAQRALNEARAYARRRRQFGSALADFQATRFALADMDTELDAARLLVYRAAWLADRAEPGRRTTREASKAKLFATEAAQRIVDRAVQIHGGCGVVKGVVVERLYREVRALRIYEGTSEIQRLIIADALLKEQ